MRGQSKSTQVFPNVWIGLIAVALGVGIGFRLWHIDHKVYWFDEVYSSFRAAGYYGTAIDQTLFSGNLVPAVALQQFQQLKPESTMLDTLGSLAVEDPQHPPLYFLMARGWMQLFGSSILASRTLPVIISLGSLPLMYLLAIELFACPLSAGFATALLALSPVDVLFAQTARQYSLLTLMVIGSGWLLLRALRLKQRRAWLWYGLSVAGGLYSHGFFLLNWLAHGGFVLWQRRGWLRFAQASGLGLLLFSPWGWVLVANRDRTLATTSWASERAELATYLKFWLLSFTSLVLDTDGDVNQVSTLLWRLPVLLLLVWALGLVVTTGTARQRQFILATALGPFLLLAIPDFILGGSRSTVTRYLLGAFPGLQLAIAYGLAYLSRRRPRQMAALWGFILACSLTSGLLSARAETWWVKGVSYHNSAVADYLHGLPSPLVITDRGDSFLNKGNLLSLSYRLAADVMVLPLPYPAQENRLPQAVSLAEAKGTLLVYYPSQTLLDWLNLQGYQSQPSTVPGLEHLSRVVAADNFHLQAAGGRNG